MHHLDKRATKPIEFPHDEHVGGPKVGGGCLELGALGPGLARLLLLEQAFAPGLGERIAL